MNTVKVKCNNCQHEFDADEAWLGMTLPCPKCQSPTTVKIFQADAPLLKIVDEGECEKSPVSDTPTAFQILADLKDDELKKLHTLSHYLTGYAVILILLAVFAAICIFLPPLLNNAPVHWEFVAIPFSLCIIAAVYRKCRSEIAGKFCVYGGYFIITTAVVNFFVQMICMPDNITVSSCAGLGIGIVIFSYIIKAGKSPLLFGKNAIADKQIKAAYECRKQGEAWTEDKCPPAKCLPGKVDDILSILAFISLALIFVAALVNTVNTIADKKSKGKNDTRTSAVQLTSPVPDPVPTAAAVPSPTPAPIPAPKSIDEQLEEATNLLLSSNSTDRSRGFQTILQLAQQSNSKAQVTCGNCYLKGIGVTQNHTEAVKWYRRAADQGNPLGQACLGECYLKGTGVAKNHAEAVRLFTLSANQGDSWGQARLGECYLTGTGVAVNPAEAIRLLTLSANQGNSLGQACLGGCYLNGVGVAVNHAEAIRLLTLSANQGNPLGQALLGVCYLNGFGVAVNHTEAVRLLTLAANQGDPMSQVLFGNCYFMGTGVAQNHTEAVKWYRRAADQGNPWGQAYLGLCYLKGTGVAKNHAEAVRLFTLSANQGDSWGQARLGECYLSGTGVAINHTEAVRLFTLSANQGNLLGQAYLGECYLKGIGVAKNYTKAIKWLQLAAKQGDQPAQKTLRSLGQTW